MSFIVVSWNVIWSYVMCDKESKSQHIMYTLPDIHLHIIHMCIHIHIVVDSICDHDVDQYFNSHQWIVLNKLAHITGCKSNLTKLTSDVHTWNDEHNGNTCEHMETTWGLYHQHIWSNMSPIRLNTKSITMKSHSNFNGTITHIHIHIHIHNENVPLITPLLFHTHTHQHKLIHIEHTRCDFAAMRARAAFDWSEGRADVHARFRSDRNSSPAYMMIQWW